MAGEGEGEKETLLPSPSPSPFHLFSSRSNFRAITRLKTLAKQAKALAFWIFPSVKAGLEVISCSSFVSPSYERLWVNWVVCSKTVRSSPSPSRHFCQHFTNDRTTEQTLLAINLASQQKRTKLYLSSQIKKQFKLLTVPFKPLRCCLRSGKLVNCQNSTKIYIKTFVWFEIWSVYQIVLFNRFLSDFVEITSCVYTVKQLFFSISVNSGFRNIYVAASRLGKFSPTIFASISKNNC